MSPDITTKTENHAGCFLVGAKDAARVIAWEKALPLEARIGIHTRGRKVKLSRPAEYIECPDVVDACLRFCRSGGIGVLVLINAASEVLPRAVIEEALDEHIRYEFDLTLFDPFYFPSQPPIIYSAALLERLAARGKRVGPSIIMNPRLDELGNLWANTFEPALEHVKTIPFLKSRLENPALFPQMISLTPTEHCNYRCRVCHVHCRDFGNEEYDQYYAFYKDPGRFKLGFMSMEMYDRLLNEAAAFKGVTNLNLGTTGEPTLHPEILAMVEHAAPKGLMVSMTTNGATLKPKAVRRLIRAGLRYLDVSIDAAAGATYKKLRGGDLDQVEGIVRTAVEAASASGAKVSVNLTVQGDNEDEIEPFVEKWVDTVDFIGVWGCHLKKRFVTGWNWRPKKRTLCKQLYRGFGVSSDGHVWSCCGGAPIEGTIGMWDGTRNLRDIWNDPDWLVLKRKYFNGQWAEVPMCRGCDVWSLNSLARTRVEGDLMVRLSPATAIYSKIRPESTAGKIGRYVRAAASPARVRAKLRAIRHERRMRKA